MTKVSVDPRKKKRDLKNALGDDILRFLTELITNSDDSYKRLQSQGLLNCGKKTIVIELGKDKRNQGYLFSITDNAEGMSPERLEKVFSNYAGNNAGGIDANARGIFGQGASDVLKAAALEKKTAMIASIKDDVVSKLIYKIDEHYDGEIDVQSIPVKGNQLKQLRSNIGIANNGTRVSFGVPSTVKFTNKIKSNLADSLEKYPYLRFLLNQKDLEVVFKHGKDKKTLSSEKYQFDETKKICDKSFSFDYEGDEIKCHLNMYVNSNKIIDNTNILVRDEKNTIYDNTMFDFKNTAAAQNLSGELIINNLYKLCYDHLNSDHPDAIVHDNRTGFDVKHPFYIELNNSIYPILEKVIQESGNKVKSTNLGNNKRFNDALKKLNKYFNDELKTPIGGGTIHGKTPPKEGIKFARNVISITKDKVYDLKLLINADIIAPGQIIDIICEDKNHVELSPMTISYSGEEAQDSLVIKNVSIKGLEVTNDSVVISAKCDARLSNVLVDVLEREIYYPENGLGFFPDNITAVIEKKHILNLYVDTTSVPIGSKIQIECEGLDVEDANITVDDAHLINQEICHYQVILTGGVIDSSYIVTATCENKSSKAVIRIIEKSKNENPGGGIIAGFKVEGNDENDVYYQSYFDQRTHYIMIISNNPINKRLLGDMKSLDSNNPKFNKEQSKHLCDIISQESAKLFVKLNEDKHGIINSDDDFPSIADSILELIERQKNNIFNSIYPSISGQAEEE